MLVKTVLNKDGTGKCFSISRVFLANLLLCGSTLDPDPQKCSRAVKTLKCNFLLREKITENNEFLHHNFASNIIKIHSNN